MVGSVAQTSLGNYQQLLTAEQSAERSVTASVTLNPDLQQLANIINDTTGAYSDSDKAKAYNQVYDSEISINGLSGGEVAQSRAFDLAIEGSTVGQALVDGKRQQFAYQNSQSAHSAGSQAQFFASLSDLQKQLAPFQGYESNAAANTQIADSIALSPTAHALLRGSGASADALDQLTSLQQQLGAAYQAAVDGTTLNSGLQRLADIINDQSGQSSDAAKVEAYVEATTAFKAVSDSAGQRADDPLYVEFSASSDQSLQFAKFSDLVKGSDVVKAAEDASAKMGAVMMGGHAGELIDDQFRAGFYNSLTNMEKLLPEYASYGETFAQAMNQSIAQGNKIAQEDPRQYASEQNAAVAEAEILFGASPAAAPIEAPAPASNNVSAGPFAQGGLRMTV